MGTTKHGETGSNTKQEIRRTKFDSLPRQSPSFNGLRRPKKRVLTSSEAADYLGYAGPSAAFNEFIICLLYTSPSPRDRTRSRMPSSA